MAKVSRIDLGSAFKTKPPPLDAVLPGLLAGTVGLLVSPGGVGKSMLMLGTAFSVGAGQDLFGIWGSAPPRGRVVIVAAEDTEAVLAHRIYALGQQIKDSDQEAVAEMVDVMPLYGGRFTIAQQRADGGLEPSPAFLRLIEFARGARLVVLDTLNRCLGGINENDAGAMGAVLALVEALCRETGAACVIVHHANKLSMVSGTGTEQHAVRGSSAITDNARWQCNLTTMDKAEAEKRGIEDDGARRAWVRLDLPKVNYGPPIAERWLQRIDGGVLTGRHGGLPEKDARRATNNGGSRRLRRDIDDE